MPKAKAPKKTRLNASKREVLLDFAYASVAHPELKVKYDLCLAVLRSHIDEILLRQCTTRELNVLRKFGRTDRGNEARVHVRGLHVNFIDGIDDDEILALNAYKAAKQEYDGVIDATRYAYRQLIQGATYFEDVTAVWPDAQQYAKAMGQKPAPIMVVTGEHLRCIQENISRQPKKAKANV